MSFFEKICNSIFLSTSVAIESLIFGSILTCFFYCLRSHWYRGTILLLLLSFFAISPIIYLVALTRISWFNQFSVFWQSSLILCLNMSPLAAILLIFSIGRLGKTSIQSGLAVAKPIRVLWHVVFPQIILSVLGIFLFVFILTFIHEEVPSFLGYRTYAEEFFARIVSMEDYRKASLASLPFLFAAGIFLVLIGYMIRKPFEHRTETESISLMYLHFDMNRSLIITNGIVLLLIIAGIIFLLMKEVDLSSLDMLAIENMDLIRNTCAISIATATMGTLCGGFLYRCFREKIKTKVLVIWGIIMMFYWLTPLSLSVLALIHFAQMIHCNSIVFDYFILIFGYLLKLLPISFLLFFIMNAMLTKKMTFILQFINVSWYDRFMKIALPVQCYKWVVVLIFLTIFTMNEISATVLLIPPGVETIVVRIYNLMHYGDFSSVAFLSLVQFVLVCTGIAITQLLMRNHDKA